MRKNKRYILDLNGVVQRYAFAQIVRFGIHLVIRFKMSPTEYVRLVMDMKKNGESASKRADEFICLYYEHNQHIKTPFLKGAVECVQDLLKTAPMHICSANKYSPESDKRYADFLTDKIGRFVDIHFVKVGVSKLAYYKDVKQQYPNDEIIVIDDSARHIADAKSIGLKAIKTDPKVGIAGVKDFIR